MYKLNMNKKTYTLRVSSAQINPTVGDISGNTGKILSYIDKACREGADIVAFPELAVTGYPPEDLLLKKKFVDDNIEAVKNIARQTGDIIAVVGFVDRKGARLFNSAAVISRGAVIGVYHKMHLPNYGVFDEKRYFETGTEASCFKYNGVIFGVNICEDIWQENGPAELQAKEGASLIININASPFHSGKMAQRETVVKKAAKRNKIFIAYSNIVGGQDELVFDGQSMLVSPEGKVLARADSFCEELLSKDIALPVAGKNRSAVVIDCFDKSAARELTHKLSAPVEGAAEVYGALKLALKDYALKNGFSRVLIGLSGGIDSAIVAVIAADALGKENVVCVFMPSQYSSVESKQDAEQLAKNIGVKYLTIPIEKLFAEYKALLSPFFEGRGEDLTEENIQSRIRGNILMALSNKFGWLVLTTGNKSEMSTGYATLYGDMAGGFAVIKDVPKVLIYELSRYRNTLGNVIPERILTKAPTAELRPGQKDTDSLPPYEILDKILKCYVEEDMDIQKIAARGFDAELVRKVVNLVDRSEYKRRQSPPGIKITERAFGKDRRVPITNRYREK